MRWSSSAEAGFKPEELKVGLHSPGYVGHSDKSAIADYYPGYIESWNKVGRERGWPPITKSQFDAGVSPQGVLVVGGPETVAQKLKRHSEALGGIDLFTFQMDIAGLRHEQLLRSIELIGSKVIPLLSEQAGKASPPDSLPQL